MRGTIVGLRGTFQGRSAPLHPGVITIGRNTGNSMPFPDDPLVSRDHCVLAFSNGEWVCWDVGSTNGTFVNGTRVGTTPAPIPTGAEIAFGAQTLRIEYARSGLGGVIDSVRNLASKPLIVSPQSPPARRTPTPQPMTTKGSEATWYGLDQEVHIQGFILVSPLCFVGTKLALPPKRQSYSLQSFPDEPGLINPSLKIRPGVPDPLPYYPNYLQATPEQRWTYLNWLYGNREGEIEQGFLFLFFYGLERYLTQCSPPPREALAVLNELIRLSEQYRNFGSFRHYAFRLYAAHWTLYPQLINEKALRLFGALPDVEFCWMLACLASHQMDLTSNLVMCWFALNASRLVKRSIWQHCEAEITQLFAIRYTSQFGDRRALRCTGVKTERPYHSANFSLRDATAPFSAYQAQDDVAILATIKETLASTAVDLQPYARARVSGSQSLRSYALIPDELLARDSQLAALALYLAANGTKGVFVVDWQELTSLLSIVAEMTKNDLTDLATILGKLGYLVEPDPAFGGKPLKDSNALAVCKQAEATSMGKDKVLSAIIIIRLAAWILSQDPQTPETMLQLPRFIAQSLAADAGLEERLNLTVRLFALRPSRPNASDIQAITADLRPRVVPLLIHALKHFCYSTRATLRELEKVARYFGIQSPELLTQMYQVEAGIPMVSPGTLSTGYAIPPPRPGDNQVIFDESKLQKRREESEGARAFLTEILTEAAPSEPLSPTAPEFPATRYAKILKALREGELPKAEFEALCRNLGLMPGKVRTELNEIAIESCGYSLIEGDDPIAIDHDCLNQMRHESTDQA